MDIKEIIKININEFNQSKERKLMIKGESYYKVEHDILNRKMIRYENESPVEDVTKANNKLSHGFMHLMVDDKVNYLLTKPYTMECKNETYLETVQEILGKRFQKTLSRLGVEASNKGIAWLYCYINPLGKFRTMKIPSEQIIPLWIDNDHEELEGVIRYYEVETYNGLDKKIVTKIEYYTVEGVEYYILHNDQVILDSEAYLNAPGINITMPYILADGSPVTWDRVPFIPFKNNDFELPDVQFVKTLIDNYDLTRSDIANLLEEIKNIVYVLKGYGGENLGEFVRDLAYYKGIKIDTDEESMVDTIENNIDIEASKIHFEQLKKDIYEFAQGVDKSSDKLGNSPSGVALKFMYSGLDLKCNAMEDNFKWSFEQLIYFVNKYMEITKMESSNDEIEIIFNRDIAINESQAITDCANSKGVISNKTIVANHPWVTDLDEELKAIEEDNKALEVELFGDSGEVDE